jgi:hypothetical protein
MSSDIQDSENFMELEVSLPFSQQPAPRSYPEPDETSPCLPTLFLKDSF